MEDQIVRIANQTLTDVETTLYSNVNGAIIKTMMIYNPGASDSEITLNIDSVIFLFSLAANETKILNSPVVINSLKATGDGINIHVSGIQLGGA